jgi:hypothetical protein
MNGLAAFFIGSIGYGASVDNANTGYFAFFCFAKSVL